ncbi:MAG: hypothetical protein PHS53_00540 [Candidatus Pacebacteria bacterium]|nr:hypothetical protein [Candidatus Paceibacterota bacterium]MDD5356624.1 hypothetical protein [Candidatus Paceibacterota bacterium]
MEERTAPWVNLRKDAKGQVFLSGTFDVSPPNRLGGKWNARINLDHKTGELAGAFKTEKGRRARAWVVIGKLEGKRFWFCLKERSEEDDIIFIFERHAEEKICRGLWAYLLFLDQDDATNQSLKEIAQELGKDMIGGEVSCSLPLPTDKFPRFRI